jgi:hypothetical protein
MITKTLLSELQPAKPIRTSLPHRSIDSRNN